MVVELTYGIVRHYLYTVEIVPSTEWMKVMPKYTIVATLTKSYQIEVDALDPSDAISQLDDWIADDFEDYETDARWTLEVI